MSRVAKNPIALPKGVEAKLSSGSIDVKGPKGALQAIIPTSIQIEIESNEIRVSKGAANDLKNNALAGTIRANIANMVAGVSTGYERKLSLVGVGYRAQAQGQVLNLSLGFSHPVNFDVPAGITVETPSQTEIVVKGCDKQKVGQVAANIRSYRPPEPYKGKGIRYFEEVIIKKEAKKK